MGATWLVVVTLFLDKFIFFYRVIILAQSSLYTLWKTPLVRETTFHKHYGYQEPFVGCQRRLIHKRFAAVKLLALCVIVMCNLLCDSRLLTTQH